MSNIELIENPDRRTEMREIGRRLFHPHNTCEGIFKPEVEACLIFYANDETDNDYLTKAHYEAIVAAAKQMGDSGFVVSDVSGIFSDRPNHRYYAAPPGVESNHYCYQIRPGAPPEGMIEVDGQELADYRWCEFPTHENYRAAALHSKLDTAMYSINARWGVYTAREWWHLVGGSIDFIRHVDKLYPAWRNDIITLVDEWEGEMARGTPIGDLLIERLPYWKKWPGDEWVDTFTAKLDRKLTGGL